MKETGNGFSLRRITMMLAVWTVLSFSARGQDFVNLDFESAYNLPGNPGEDGVRVPATNALPGWTAFNGSVLLSEVYYASSSTYGPQAMVGLNGGSLALSGGYSVELFSNGSISQTGLVPDDAESLEFEAYALSPASGFSISLGGQTLSYSTISQGANYDDIYGANLPAGMAGQTEALDLFCVGIGSGDFILDNIEFLSTSVPEPCEYALIGLGTILLLFRYSRSKLSGAVAIRGIRVKEIVKGTP